MLTTDLESCTGNYNLRFLLSNVHLLLINIGVQLLLILALIDYTLAGLGLPTAVEDTHDDHQHQYVIMHIILSIPQTIVISYIVYKYLSDSKSLRRKAFLWSTLLFGTGSSLCGIFPKISTVCLFRAITGAGSTGIVVSAQVIIEDLNSDFGDQRPRWSWHFMSALNCISIFCQITMYVTSAKPPALFEFRYLCFVIAQFTTLAGLLLLFSFTNLQMRE